ncbi:MAG: cold shock domain-containing protein [Rhodospirillaceae bacterium]|nr:cold shock domain-containing protein [Rhodospirillaceae bacterium]
MQSSGGSSKSGVTAKVKWFNPAKGFGFVAPTDGSPDAFLHVSIVQRAGFRTLRQGATIICDLGDGPRGLQVSDIQRVDESSVVDDAPQSSGQDSVLEGEVKFFSPEKGYGFAVPAGGGPDVFIGIGALQRSNLDRLESGQRVRMSVQPGKKGPTATRIEILSSPQPR